MHPPFVPPSINSQRQQQQQQQKYLVADVKQRLINVSVRFHAALRRQHLKTFATMYSVAKPAKANTKWRSLSTNSAGRSVKVESIFKHELSLVPLPLAKSEGQVNSAPKADLCTQCTSLGNT